MLSIKVEISGSYEIVLYFKAKAARKAEKKQRKSKSAPSEKSGKTKKKTKLAGQPKKPMSAYFLWMNEEGR